MNHRPSPESSTLFFPEPAENLLSVRLTDVSVAFCAQNGAAQDSVHSVVRGVNAAFPATGLFVLVGRSGSGKTTLLRTMNRLNEEFPGCTTSGRIELNLGRGLESILPPLPATATAQSLPELRRRVGMVFQTPNVFPASIQKNLSIPLEHVAGCPKSEIADRVQAALQSVGLWNEVCDRLNTPAERLSGGQQQRLCLARTLALEPALLLLDEPTASLDVRAAREVEALLVRLAENYPVIMVSHSLPQACRLGQQVLVLQDGEIIRHFTEGETLSEEQLSILLENED